MGAASVIGVWMLALSVYDLRQRRLPNWLTLPGAALILLDAAVVGRGPSAGLGAIALGGLYLVVHLVNSQAMGGGDVKLALGLGALTGTVGVDAWMLAALGAPLLTALCAVPAVLVAGVRTVPHGPSMCLSSAVAVLMAAA
ncbi:MAG: A24 family peptidase [Mycobacterium sp.]